MEAYAGEDEEQGEHASIADDNANLHCPFRNQYGSFSEKVEIDLPQDPVIPFLSPKDAPSYNLDTCSTMFKLYS